MERDKGFSTKNRTTLNDMYITTESIRESKEGGIFVIIRPTNVWSMSIFTS